MQIRLQNPARAKNRRDRRVQLPPKTLLIMRLTFFLFIAGVLHANAHGIAQTVSLRLGNAPLKTVFKAIEQQTHFIFFTQADLLEKGRKVSVDLQDVPLKEALDACFRNQPFTYSIEGRIITLEAKPIMPPPAPAPILFSVITGVVTSENGTPLSGASIFVKGSTTGTTTDVSGHFTIKAEHGQVLVISYTGYHSLEVTIQGTEPLKITLSPSTNKLDEIQVVGYGTTTRRTSTGSVSTITAEDIEKQPVTNPLLALEGKVPGLLITQVSGAPGAGVNIEIRAAASLTAGTTPLFIIDGVPYSSDPLYNTGGNTVGYLQPSFGSSPLNAINPSDIESISVLKDADATAIYGSRGANGVILITTKKGKSNKTTFEMNVSTGVNTVQDQHRISTLSLKQYLEIRRQAYINAGTTPTKSNAPDLTIWDTTHSTDWQKLLFGGTAHTTDVSASVSGGSGQTSFLLSGTYHKEGQVIPGNFDYQRGAIHFTVTHQSPDRKFGLNAAVTYNLDKNNSSARTFQSSDLANAAYSLAPNYPLYDSTGKNLYWFNSYSTYYTNPLSYTYARYSANNNNLVGNITLRYNPFTGLTLKVSSSYNRLTLYQQNLNYSKSLNPYTGGKPGSNFQENYTTAWNVEPQAEYTHNINRGRLNLLAGGTLQGNTYVQPYYIVASNFTSDNLLSNYSSAGTYSAWSFNSAYKYSSIFSRANYNWLNKYILNLNYRWDASSKFGINHRYGSFYSVGAAWVFSAEHFAQHLPWLSFGKLRSSYGRTGNDQISNYQYYDTYTTSTYTYDNVSGLYPNNVANPNLEWEVNKKLEMAIDLGFLKDRISVSGAWFINRTSNPLVNYPLATLSGFSSYTANMKATIQSSGPEFELTTQNIKSKHFSWTTAFNISFPQNKLVSFPNILNTGYINTNIVGESMNSVHLFKYTGIDKTTNLPTFLDANKDGVSNYPEPQLAAYGQGDYVTVGKTDPDFFGGLNNSFQYKGFQLDAFIQFVGKRMIPGILSQSYTGYYAPGYAPINMYNGIYDLFKQTNGKIATRSFDFSPGSAFMSYYMYSQSSAIISNAAFARLKNISLSYTMPGEWIKKMKMSSYLLYVRAQNLFTVTRFAGYDPESSPANIPPLRTIICGLKCSF